MASQPRKLRLEIGEIYLLGGRDVVISKRSRARKLATVICSSKIVE
jgi:hypothetical protein